MTEKEYLKSGEKPVLEEINEVESVEPIRFNLSIADANLRLDKVLSTHKSEFSRSRIQKWIEKGLVLVNGEVASNKQIVFGGEEIVMYPETDPQELSFAPENITLPIVYEDDTVIVINKPAGLVVHPGAGNWSGTLLNGLLFHAPELKHVPRAGIVHRLDKETSGLLVVAKTIKAQTHLVRQLQDRSVHREYAALVLGQFRYEVVFNEAIGRHPKNRIKMAVLKTASAKEAITQVKPVATGEINNAAVTLVTCRLQTGRTHQIRVHLSYHNYPIIGDPLYGKTHSNAWFSRQALHAYRLGFIHPKTNELISFGVDLPDDMKALLSKGNISLESLNDVHFSEMVST